MNQEMAALNDIDEALSDCKALIATLRDALLEVSESARPVPFAPRNLFDTLGVMYDLCVKAENARDALDPTH